jgi:8-oxo-dGTP pyrophosphatase MutT (NUDIX family)
MPALSPDNTAELRQRRRVFQNTRFTVYADHISEGELEVADYLVVAPHSGRTDLLTGVAVIPVREDSILLLKRHRHAISQHVWEVPRGFIDADEEPAYAALRELSEETGFVCSQKDLIDLGTFFPDAGIIRAQVALFAATQCRPGVEPIDDEIGLHGGEWHPMEEVRRMLNSGVLQEGASCVALHRYYARLDERRSK